MRRCLGPTLPRVLKLLFWSLLSQALVALLIGLVGGGVSFWLLSPKDLDVEWPERARHTWPARIGGALVMLVFPLFAGAVVPLLAGLEGTRLPAAARCFLAAGLPVHLLRMRFERAMHPEPERLAHGSFLRGRAAVVIVRFGHILLCFALGLALCWLPV